MRNTTALLAATLLLAPATSYAMAGTNTVDSNAIVNGTIANVDLANGAVTDAKISGKIASTKLPIGITSTSVAAGNHNHDEIYQKKYSNVIVVAKGGGDFTDPVAAISSITNSSATNPYLVKIMPGIYSIGATNLNVPPGVDIQGSGPAVTKITGNNTAGAYGVIALQNNHGLTISDLSIENTGGGANAVALSVGGSSPANSGGVTIDNVKLYASNSASNYGLYCMNSSEFIVKNSNITAHSGVWINNLCNGMVYTSEVNSTDTANGMAIGMFNGSSLEIHDSKIMGDQIVAQYSSSLNLYDSKVVFGNNGGHISLYDSTVDARNIFINGNTTLDSIVGGYVSIANSELNVGGSITNINTGLTCFNNYNFMDLTPFVCN
ncbi:MAG: hypothetical protein HGA96_07705 [Desulfobulbaceae bacterium]|nr:hypothetical protein [Desulfobulbaceae bacterium]